MHASTLKKFAAINPQYAKFNYPIEIENGLHYIHAVALVYDFFTKPIFHDFFNWFFAICVTAFAHDLNFLTGDPLLVYN
jgi:hypothetical protein